jgi:predicted membrane GTPase involved in stress response
VMISFEEGSSTFYAMQNAEDRGVFFIKPGTKVYKGMIVGEHNRPQDIGAGAVEGSGGDESGAGAGVYWAG